MSIGYKEFEEILDEFKTKLLEELKDREYVTPSHIRGIIVGKDIYPFINDAFDEFGRKYYRIDNKHGMEAVREGERSTMAILNAFSTGALKCGDKDEINESKKIFDIEDEKE